MEFDPTAHEEFVSKRLAEARARVARIALFDEMIDYHLDGQCSFDEALAQFMHDANEQGIGFETA